MDIKELNKIKDTFDIQNKEIDILLSCVEEVSKFAERNQDIELCEILMKYMDRLIEFC